MKRRPLGLVVAVLSTLLVCAPSGAAPAGGEADFRALSAAWAKARASDGTCADFRACLGPDHAALGADIAKVSAPSCGELSRDSGAAALGACAQRALDKATPADEAASIRSRLDAILAVSSAARPSPAPDAAQGSAASEQAQAAARAARFKNPFEATVGPDDAGAAGAAPAARRAACPLCNAGNRSVSDLGFTHGDVPGVEQAAPERGYLGSLYDRAAKAAGDAYDGAVRAEQKMEEATGPVVSGVLEGVADTAAGLTVGVLAMALLKLLGKLGLSALLSGVGVGEAVLAATIGKILLGVGVVLTAWQIASMVSSLKRWIAAKPGTTESTNSLREFVRASTGLVLALGMAVVGIAAAKRAPAAAAAEPAAASQVAARAKFRAANSRLIDDNLGIVSAAEREAAVRTQMPALNDAQVKAVLSAHEKFPCAGAGCTQADLRGKYEIFQEAGMTRPQMEDALDRGLAGNKFTDWLTGKTPEANTVLGPGTGALEGVTLTVKGETLALQLKGKTPATVIGDVRQAGTVLRSSQNIASARIVSEYSLLMKSGKWNWASGPRIELGVGQSGETVILNGHHRVMAAQVAGIKIPESAFLRTRKPAVAFDWNRMSWATRIK
jgi:hypothetical protein